VRVATENLQSIGVSRLFKVLVIHLQYLCCDDTHTYSIYAVDDTHMQHAHKSQNKLQPNEIYGIGESEVCSIAVAENVR